MITVEQALEKALENAGKLPVQTAPLTEAVDRILAQDLKARQGLPPFDNSAMDGFAVRSQDLSQAAPGNPVRLRILGSVRAGCVATTVVGAGETLRIMTGAPLPEGADAVVMKELVLEEGGEWVAFAHRPHPGENVRPRWEDIAPGAPLLPRGTPLRPYEISLLAAQGLYEVPVVRRPVVAVLATGDELVDVRERELKPGQIRNSNGPALAAAVSRWGALPQDLGTVGDQRGHLMAAFEKARAGADLLLVSGGVSVGDFDLTRAALEELGFETVFWKVAMKPGKPLLFGLLPATGRKVPVFGLPGNPVAALVCLELFVRPVLERMQGRSFSVPSWHLEGVVENGYRMHDERRHFLFCQVRGQMGGFRVHILRPQGSAMLGMACKANALAMAPEGAQEVRPGDRIPFRWLK